jgi:hypothetical protein
VVGFLVDCLENGGLPYLSSGEKLEAFARINARKPPLDTKKRKVQLNCMIYFKNNAHGDPENVRKGIMDALFVNDKHVIGYYDYDIDPEAPRVEVELEMDVDAKKP